MGEKKYRLPSHDLKPVSMIIVALFFLIRVRNSVFFSFKCAINISPIVTVFIISIFNGCI